MFMFKKTKISTILLACFSLLILGGLIYWANPTFLAETVSKADLRYLILAFGVCNLAVWVRVVKWKVLLPPTSKISSRSLFPVQVLGVTISNFTPGKIGEPVKAVILKVKEKKAVSETLPSIAWERILDLLALIIIGMIGISFFAGHSELLSPLILSIGLSLGGITLLLLILYSKQFGTWVFSLVKKLPGLNKKIGKQFLDTFYAHKISKAQGSISFFFTMLMWFLEGLAFYLVSLSFNVSPPLLAVVGIYAISILLGVVSFLPGGLGSTELVAALCFGWMGVEKTTAATISLVGRALILGYITALGCVSLFYLKKKVSRAL